MDFDEFEEIAYIFVLIFFMAMSFLSLIFVFPVIFLVFYMVLDETRDNDDESDDSGDSSNNS